MSRGKTTPIDPVRTYLAALGAVPLLKREQEVVLAKQIERGEKMVMTAVSRSPIGIEALLRTADELRDGLAADQKCRANRQRRRPRRRRLNSSGF